MATAAGQEIVERIRLALGGAREALKEFVPGAVDAEHKPGGRGPVTEADLVADRVLRDLLVRDSEGWLSEESADEHSRMKKRVVWVVDPLDGTREFVEGIPEWCISVGLVEDNQALAGGICNPATGELFLGSKEGGMTRNGERVRVTERTQIAGALVLASRSEVRRGEWNIFEGGSFTVQAMGSVAYKLARVAAGLADATWTLSPKNEWDIAGGVALVEAAGGMVRTLELERVRFNERSTLRSGLIACGPGLFDEIASCLGPHLRAASLRRSRVARG
jgi:myo-inositol-1(or 4)-monophosphatase